MQLTAEHSAQTCCTWSRFWKLVMLHHGNRGKRAGKRKGRKLGSICVKLVDGFVCRNIPAESNKMRRSYVIYRTDDMNIGGSETERPRCFWIQIVIGRNSILAVNNDGINFTQNNCPLNDCQYGSNININGASMILIWSFRQSMGCKVTLIQRQVIGRI